MGSDDGGLVKMRSTKKDLGETEGHRKGWLAMRAMVAAQLIASNPDLHAVTPGSDKEKVAQANMVRHLGRFFPGFEFKVTLSGTGGEKNAWIHWKDGPIEDDVYRQCEAFARSCDGQVDEGATQTSWHETFGSVQNVMPMRSYSDDAVTCVISLLEKRAGPAFASLGATAQKWRNRSLSCHELTVPAMGKVRAQSLVDYVLSRTGWAVA